MKKSLAVFLFTALALLAAPAASATMDTAPDTGTYDDLTNILDDNGFQDMEPYSYDPTYPEGSGLWGDN